MLHDMIPLARPNIGPRELAAAQSALRSGWLGMGPAVERFEGAVAAYVGARHCVAVSSGTSALHLALETVGVRGSEVVVPSLTFAATVQAILAAGGIPVFADCRADDLNLDVDDAAARLNRRTRAVVAVDYAGRPADLARLIPLAEARGAVVIEDAAHAFGSAYADGTRVGSGAHLTCFSFDPIKTITCCEGGAVCTSNELWAEQIRRKRRLGIRTLRGPAPDRRYRVVEPGFRCHLNDVNAAVGLAQLERADELIAARRRAAHLYDERLRGLPGLALLRHDLSREAPFCYTVRVLGRGRRALMRSLAAAGIETAVLYPPNHREPAFAAFAASLPTTERISSEHMSLPLFAGISDAQVDHVITRIASHRHRRDLPA